MEKTIEALKQAYSAALSEIGQSSPYSMLTQEIGALIIRYSKGHGPSILETLRRDAKPLQTSKASNQGESKRSQRRPFIHPHHKIIQSVPVVLGEPLENQEPPHPNQILQATTEESNPGDQEQQSHQPPQSPTLQTAAVVAPENQPIPLVEFKDLSVNTIASRYARSRIIATLEKNGLKYIPENSERQLAKILLDSLKKDNAAK